MWVFSFLTHVYIRDLWPCAPIHFAKFVLSILDMNQIIEFFGQAQNILSEGGFVSWLALIILAFLLTIGIKLLLVIVSKYLRILTKKTTSAWDDVAVDLLDGLKKWILFIFILYFLIKFFQPVGNENNFLMISFVAAWAIQGAIWGLYLIKNWRQRVLDKIIKKDQSSSAALGLLYTVIQVVFLSFILLLGLSNIGIDISALVTGLGVGGIAVALAAQNVLGDLLASLSIVLDKPFVIGDFIIAGDEKGTVEHIGIKTTRLRSLSGEQIILSNKDLLESRVKNYKRMLERRVVMKFGVVYSTPAEVLEKIPNWVKQFVEKYEVLRFDRCHFDTFAESSLDFELVFHVLSSEFNIFMDFKQLILLDIFRKFSDEGIDFAFPTQSIFIEKKPE
jgi:small-conductance mechanosensitive channel